MGELDQWRAVVADPCRDVITDSAGIAEMFADAVGTPAAEAVMTQ